MVRQSDAKITVMEGEVSYSQFLEHGTPCTPWLSTAANQGAEGAEESRSKSFVVVFVGRNGQDIVRHAKQV